MTVLTKCGGESTIAATLHGGRSPNTQNKAGVLSHPHLEEFSPPLDEGVALYVKVLKEHGIETFESCQGGIGHSYAEPTVRFHGGQSEGFKAFSIAQQHAFPVASIRRTWPVIDGEPTGPWWEMTFRER